LPSATEILFAIGAGDDVVAVTHECDHPPEAVRLPKATSSTGPELRDAGAIDRHVRAAIHAGSSLYALDAELLDRLYPDLIVTQELCAVCAVSYDIVATAAKRLRSCHPERGREARIISLEPSSLDDVLANIQLLGQVTGRSDGAQRLIEWLRSRIATLRQRAGHARPRTLLLEWTDPPMSAGHWIPELIELAGGTPILADPGVNSRRLEWDAIGAADPDVVIVAPCGFDLEKTRSAIEQLAGIAQWRTLRAVREGRLLPFDGNAYVSRPGPRLVDTAEMIAQWYTTVAEYAG
jgi:iron complex transport system substrate-binding protein